jgi:hypothetical protein
MLGCVQLCRLLRWCSYSIISRAWENLGVLNWRVSTGTPAQKFWEGKRTTMTRRVLPCLSIAVFLWGLFHFLRLCWGRAHRSFDKSIWSGFNTVLRQLIVDAVFGRWRTSNVPITQGLQGPLQLPFEVSNCVSSKNWNRESGLDMAFTCAHELKLSGSWFHSCCSLSQTWT